MRNSGWEQDAAGGWQPRGGIVLYIHFNGFPHKWNEWIHSACFIPDASNSDALGPSLRPRLAPLHTMTPQPGSERSSSRRLRFRVGEAVSVSVHIPLPEPDTPPARVSSRYFEPQFEQKWLQAIVVVVEHDQMQIRYEPPQDSDDSFTFPVWFTTRLDEVKRFGPAQLQPTHDPTLTARNGRAAGAAEPQSQQLDDDQRASFSPVTAITDKLKSFLSPFSSTPPPEDAVPIAAHTPAAASPYAAASYAAAFPATPPYKSTAPAARSSISQAATAASAAATAAVPAVTTTSPPPARTNVAAMPPSTRYLDSTPARPAAPAAVVPPPPPAAASRSVDYAPLLRASQSAPLRSPVGIINMGNSCYISAGLQCLSGLLPLIQYFVVERQHIAVLRQRLNTAKRQLLPPPANKSESPLDPNTLPHNFGELTEEFAQIMHALHSGKSLIYPDHLKRLVVRLPNDAGSRFAGVRMQDAHEFLSVLLNALQNELNTAPPMAHATANGGGGGGAAGQADGHGSVASWDPAAAAHRHWHEFQLRNTDVLSHLFYCQAAQYVICNACKHPSCNHHVMGQLTLDIPHVQPAAARVRAPPFSSPFARMGGLDPGGGDGDSEWAEVTLDQCLATQLAADRLDDYFCARCQRKNAAITSSYFTSLPPLLLIQLKRFDALVAALSGSGGSGGALPADVKDQTPCSYPLDLDLAPLLRPHPSVSALATAPYTLSHRSVPYRLVSVVRHHDEHYTAFSRVRDPDSGRPAWGYFNDSRTFIETDEDVLAHKHTVYLLVYQKKDTMGAERDN